MNPLPRLRLTYFLAFASLGCFMPFVALYLERRGIAPEEVSWMLAVVPLARIGMPPLWGWIADRAGSPVPVLRGLALVASLSSFGYFLVEGRGGLFGVLLLQGIFHASVFPMLDAVGLALIPRHGGDYGEVRSQGSLGFLLGVLAAGVLWRGEGLALAPAGLGVLSTGVLLAALSLPVARGAAHEPPRLEHLGEIVRCRPLLAVYLVSFLHEMVICGYDLYFAVHMRSLGLPTTITGLAWASGVGVEILVLRRGSSLMERLGPRGMMLSGIGLGFLRWQAIALTADPWILVPLQAAHAFTFGAWFLGSITLVDRLAPPKLRATAQGVFYAVLFGLGVSAGAKLWGWMVATRSSSEAFRAMGLTELLPLAACLLLVPSRAPPKQGDATASAP